MKMINNIKAYRTSILGLLIIGVSIYTVLHKEGVNWSDIVIPLCMGILLLLSPDTIPKIIENFILGRKNEEG